MKKRLISLLVGILFLINTIGVCSLFSSLWNFFGLDGAYEGFFMILVFLGDGAFIIFFQNIENYLDEKVSSEEYLNKLNRLNSLDYSKLKQIKFFTIEKRTKTYNGLYRESSDKYVDYYVLVAHVKDKPTAFSDKLLPEKYLVFETPITDVNQIPDTQEKLNQLDEKIQERNNNVDELKKNNN